MLLFSHLSVRRVTFGCCGSSYGDRYIHSLVVNHRRFTAFTRGYASVPTYGGNACITTSYYIPFLFAIRQWELSGKYFSRGLRKVRKDYVAHLPFIHKWFRRNIHCFARMLPSGRQSTSVSVCASAYSPYKTSSILHSFCVNLRCLREKIITLIYKTQQI